MSKKRILIVDESDLDRKALELFLHKRGFDVIALASGEHCLEMVEMKRPDVVLLDIFMPNLHGKQLLHFIREKYSAVELPVLMITDRNEASDIVESLALGANDYIIKPFDYDIAMMRIGTHLKIVELSKNMVRLAELEAVNAMITTYNHEINSPLAVALGEIKSLQKSKNWDENEFSRLDGALWRVANIVKKIDRVTTTGAVEYGHYSNKTKMVKIR